MPTKNSSTDPGKLMEDEVRDEVAAQAQIFKRAYAAYLKPRPLREFSPIQMVVYMLAFALIGFFVWLSFAASNPNLPGDLNNDNTVNAQDLSLLLSNYGTTNPAGDVNSDGTVNAIDLSILLSHYGQSYTSAATNLALNKPATASSVEFTGTEADKAFDGSTTTRWSSLYSDPQWLEVDLGSTQTISQVVINWEAAYAKAYQIQTSNDNSTWTTIYSTTNGAGGIETINATGSGRYVRMYGTQRATTFGYSIFEMQVFGPGAGGGGTTGSLRFAIDYSSGVLAQNDGNYNLTTGQLSFGAQHNSFDTTQDYTNTSAPDAAGFWPGSVTLVNDPAGSGKKVAKFETLPAGTGEPTSQNAGMYAWGNHWEPNISLGDEYYGFKFYIPSGNPPDATFYGVNLWQKSKAHTGDPMFGGSESLDMMFRGSATNGYEQIALIVQSGAFSPYAYSASQWYSGESPVPVVAPSGVDPRYVGTNPFPMNPDGTAAGLHPVPHSLFAYNTWMYIILHVHHATDTTGGVEAWAKKALDAGWTHTIPYTSGFPTEEWLASAGPQSALQYPKYDNVGLYGNGANGGMTAYNGGYWAGSTAAAVASGMGLASPN